MLIVLRLLVLLHLRWLRLPGSREVYLPLRFSKLLLGVQILCLCTEKLLQHGIDVVWLFLECLKELDHFRTVALGGDCDHGVDGVGVHAERHEHVFKPNSGPLILLLPISKCVLNLQELGYAAILVVIEKYLDHLLCNLLKCPDVFLGPPCLHHLLLGCIKCLILEWILLPVKRQTRSLVTLSSLKSLLTVPLVHA